MIKKLILAAKRIISPVRFLDPHRTAPVSRVFGLDRGTPIDRYYIENFLKANSSDIRGCVLEISESLYSRRYGADQVDRFEVLHASSVNPNATITGDLTDMNKLPASIADCFICTQTFNFIFNVHNAVAGAYHLLKPGGVLLATVAGICQISRYDMDQWGDYWRFTTASVHRVFEPVFGDSLQIGCHGNCLAACALLQGVVVEDLPDVALLDNVDPDYQVVITILARKPA